VPIGSVLPNDCPTRIIKWLSIIWRLQRGGKIIKNGYVFYIDAHDSEFGWKTRRRQNDLQWIQLVAGNKFSDTVYRIQAWRIAGATAYVMNCNLWPSDCTNINIALFWAPIEQLQLNKTTKYQTPSLFDLLNHGHSYSTARPVGNNSAWKYLLADSWLTDWHVPCLCCVQRCCAWWSETVKEKMDIIFWEEIEFFRCFYPQNETTYQQQEH